MVAWSGYQRGAVNGIALWGSSTLVGTLCINSPGSRAGTTQYDRLRQMAAAISNPDTAVLKFGLELSPLCPHCSPTDTTHTQTSASLPLRRGGAGAEADTRVIYSRSAVRLLADNPAITSHCAQLLCLPESSYKEPQPHSRAQRWERS